MTTAASSLPIDEALPALHEALRARCVAVLEAPPGAGKTTRVPLALRDAAWLHGLKIVMLEPRRLAARAAAHYMARLLGEPVGETVGYRVRGDTRISSRTRIEVVTEGVLARLLAADPVLEDYGLVIFDEYHERSLHADLGLALVLETQQQVRDSLRVLVMSATLDGDAVAMLLADAEGPAPIVRSAGRMYPIETHYRPPRTDERLDATTSRVIREALRATTGDVLVFLPGAGEQRRVAERLNDDAVLHEARARVHTLHGSMPLAAQDAALAPAPEGERKVVLSTSVAETSLTVAGVRVVVDCGLSRVPRYDVSAGLTRLHTVRVSRASADQRRGRAGRTAPGTCYRLWDQHEDHALLPHTRPEILDADLGALALELADAGIRDPLQLRWLDAPRAGAYAQACALLSMLGALDDTSRITAHGKRMAALPLAPRLAHLVLIAASQGQLQHGAQLAALLEERDLLQGDRALMPADMRLRTELLEVRGGREPDSVPGAMLHQVRVDRDGVRRVRQVADDLVRRLRAELPRVGTELTKQHAELSTNARMRGSDDDVGALLAMAFPDRIAQRRPGAEPRYLLRNGSGAILAKLDALRDAPYLAVADLEGQPPEARIVRATPLSLDDIRALFADQLVRDEQLQWDERTRSIRARVCTMLGALVLDESALPDPDRELMLAILCEQIRRAGLAALPWSSAARGLHERLLFVRLHDESWPDVSDEALLGSLASWAAPYLAGLRKWTQLESVDWQDALLSLCTWAQRAALERVAPTHLEVPSGSRIAVDYTDPSSPVLAVKLQEVFGWTTTPRLMDGRVSLTLHLLSPAQRPVQVTRDLAGFWQSSYFEVRKELRGRYPRHPWPEDPLTAEPTRRAKPRGT